MKVLLFDERVTSPVIVKIGDDLKAIRSCLRTENYHEEAPLGTQPHNDNVMLYYPCDFNSDSAYLCLDTLTAEVVGIFPCPFLIAGLDWNDQCEGMDTLDITANMIEKLDDHFKFVKYSFNQLEQMENDEVASILERFWGV